MNDAWYSDDSDGQQSQANGMKTLRDYAESQKKQNDELRKELNDLRGMVMQNTIADIFESNGISRSFASHYKGESTPDAVNQFIQDARNAFGVATSAPTEATPSAPSFDQKQYEQMSQAGANGTPLNTAEDAMAALGNANSPAEIMAAMQRAQRMG